MTNYINRTQYPSGLNQNSGLRRIFYDKTGLRRIFFHEKSHLGCMVLIKKNLLNHSGMHLIWSSVYQLIGGENDSKEAFKRSTSVDIIWVSRRDSDSDPANNLDLTESPSKVCKYVVSTQQWPSTKITLFERTSQSAWLDTVMIPLTRSKWILVY